MSVDQDSPRPGAGFAIEPRNRYFEANLNAVEHEIRPGNTVSFLCEVDLTEIERIRADATPGARPSYTAFVVKAVALALKALPYANRRVCRPPRLFSGPRLQAFHRVDVAVAVERDLPGAESVAFIDVLRDADAMSLAEIGDALRALATCDASTNRQWREFSGIIARFPAWLAALLIRLPCGFPGLWARYRGGAALVSSPAKYGVDAVLGTWMHPLGISFGLAKLRPVVRDGAVAARPTFHLSVNFDRRVMAGGPAARFVRRVADLLEQAESSMAPYLPSRAAPPPPTATAGAGPEAPRVLLGSEA